MKTRIAVVHLVDTLALGGAERVAVNLANLLPPDRYDVTLCTTRHEGPLAQVVQPHVRRLRLERKHTADVAALRRLIRFNQDHRVAVLHAHSTAVFLATAAAAFAPWPAVVWHDHFGSSGIRTRPTWLYRPLGRRLDAVVSVNQQLRDWAVRSIGVSHDRVCYLPNFVTLPEPSVAADGLPGSPGHRIVCVANFRPQKDHLTLVAAMARVVRARPHAHLLLIGARTDAAYMDGIHAAIQARGLRDHVTILGERSDATGLLQACDLAVLSSASEGLPLAVLEYGAAEIPVVATAVGQIPEVLANGDAGVLVPAGSPDALSERIIELLGSESRRKELAARLRHRVDTIYSAGAAIRRLCSIYDVILTSNANVA